MTADRRNYSKRDLEMAERLVRIESKQDQIALTLVEMKKQIEQNKNNSETENEHIQKQLGDLNNARAKQVGERAVLAGLGGFAALVLVGIGKFILTFFLNNQ